MAPKKGWKGWIEAGYATLRKISSFWTNRAFSPSAPPAVGVMQNFILLDQPSLLPDYAARSGGKGEGAASMLIEYVLLTILRSLPNCPQSC
ncbi:MAG TPA: hypothetical protein VGO47_03415 [Chlamydiales bacterium]|nr:hypothetical protein [Chlamydiales bacterium]